MIWDRISGNNEKRDIDVNDWHNVYSFENGYENGYGSDLSESTYFSCLKIIAETIAKCPILVKQETDLGDKIDKKHYLYDLLRLRPNEYMSAVDVMKTFVVLMKHYGIAGLYIDRSGSRIKGLYPVKITNITIDDIGLIKSSKNNKILYDIESVDGETTSCFDKDIIVIRDFSLDGIYCKATRKLLSKSLDTSIKSQNYLNQLFSDGLTNKVVVQLMSDIKDESELKKIQEKFGKIYSNNRRIFTVPAGYNVSSLNLSLSDAQFAELRKMSKEDIAGAMGVPMSKLGIVSDNAKSDEQDNISFLNDTLQVIFTAIEQEMEYKLLTKSERDKGYKIRINVGVMLRMDALTQSSVITNYVKQGVYSLQYAQDILGVPQLEGKPIITFPSGQVLLQDLLNGNTSYQKGIGGDDNDKSRG